MDELERELRERYIKEIFITPQEYEMVVRSQNQSVAVDVLAEKYLGQDFEIAAGGMLILKERNLVTGELTGRSISKTRVG